LVIFQAVDVRDGMVREKFWMLELFCICSFNDDLDTISQWFLNIWGYIREHPFCLPFWKVRKGMRIDDDADLKLISQAEGIYVGDDEVDADVKFIRAGKEETTRGERGQVRSSVVYERTKKTAREDTTVILFHLRGVWRFGQTEMNNASIRVT
jgi:hypothetical protein